jgi:membrane-bound lytic murein transglycosylase D
MIKVSQRRTPVRRLTINLRSAGGYNSCMSRPSWICALALSLACPSFAVLAANELPPIAPDSAAGTSKAKTPSASLDATTAPVETDLWQRVRRGFVMGELVSPLVQSQELWYANRPDYINRFVERGARYMHHIIEEVEKRGLPTEIVLLPIIESAFNPQAYSRAHASGMWQFIPSTGKNFGLKQDFLTDNRRDVLLSTNAALDYLTKLYGMFNSWELAFAAYNCGEGCVGRAIAYNQRKGLPTDFVNLRLPNETKAYVPKLIAVKNIILSPASYGIDLPALENRPYFTMVPAPEKIDVSLAAKLAEMEQESFAQLNPSFNRPVAASGTGYFLVPIEHADIFRFNLDLYKSLNAPMVSWAAVSAKRGEAVDAVARRHGMTAAYLRATNGPFKERKGRFTAPANFMAPNPKDASAILAAFDQKVVLKREQLYGTAAGTEGDDGPLIKGPSKSDPIQFAGLGRVAKIEPPEATTSAVMSATTASLSDASMASSDAGESNSEAMPGDTVATIWIAYRVVKGDTLFNIAKRAGIPLVALKAENQLVRNTVTLGQNLRVPSSAAGNFETPVVADAGKPSLSRGAASAKVVDNTPNRAKANAAVTYTVRNGDTLYAIARKFQTSVDALLALNRLKANTVLRPGLRLTITG